MTRPTFKIVVLLAALILPAIPWAADYDVNWLVVGSGGATEISSENFGARMTVGQPVAGQCASSTFRATFGFWPGGRYYLTDVSREDNTPTVAASFSLSQNYPNPFNPVTTIEYSVPRRAYVSIEVYNILGQRVRTLVDQVKSLGSYAASWDGTDADGRPVTTGIYLYRFRAGEYVETRKMLLLK